MARPGWWRRARRHAAAPADAWNIRSPGWAAAPPTLPSWIAVPATASETSRLGGRPPSRSRGPLLNAGRRRRVPPLVPAPPRRVQLPAVGPPAAHIRRGGSCRGLARFTSEHAYVPRRLVGRRRRAALPQPRLVHQHRAACGVWSFLLGPLIQQLAVRPAPASPCTAVPPPPLLAPPPPWFPGPAALPGPPRPVLPRPP